MRWSCVEERGGGGGVWGGFFFQAEDGIRDLVRSRGLGDVYKRQELDRGRLNRYCKTVDPNFLREVNRKKPQTMSQFADVWYKSQHADYGRSQHYNDSRYHMLNFHATFTKGTIEFRLFQFDAPKDGKQNGLHAGQLKSYIQLCLALSQMAKEAKGASPKPQQNENPKYAMRTWLLRLGFIGEEFATAREFLTKRLSGDASFRSGVRPASTVSA